jgi:hypothetical protein
MHTHPELLVDWIDQAIHLLFKIAILHTVLYTPTFFNTSDNEHLSHGPLRHIKGYLQLYIFPVSVPEKKKRIQDLQVVLFFLDKFCHFFGPKKSGFFSRKLFCKFF